MEEEQITSAIESAFAQRPVAMGNSRYCYNIADTTAVLIEPCSRDYLEDKLKTNTSYKEGSDYLRSLGVQTPQIHDVRIVGDNVVMVEDFASGIPVYHRNAERYCMASGIKPAAEEKKEIESEIAEPYLAAQGLPTYKELNYSQRKETDWYVQCVLAGNNSYAVRYRQAQEKQQEQEAQYIAENEAHAEAIINMPQQHFDKFLQNIITVNNAGYSIDCNSDNYIMHPENGFTMVDLDADPSRAANGPYTRKPEVVCSFIIDILTRGANVAQVPAIFERCAVSITKLGFTPEECVGMVPYSIRRNPETLLALQEVATKIEQQIQQPVVLQLESETLEQFVEQEVINQQPAQEFEEQNIPEQEQPEQEQNTEEQPSLEQDVTLTGAEIVEQFKTEYLQPKQAPQTETIVQNNTQSQVETIESLPNN